MPWTWHWNSVKAVGGAPWTSPANPSPPANRRYNLYILFDGVLLVAYHAAQNFPCQQHHLAILAEFCNDVQYQPGPLNPSANSLSCTPCSTCIDFGSGLEWPSKPTDVLHKHSSMPLSLDSTPVQHLIQTGHPPTAVCWSLRTAMPGHALLLPSLDLPLLPWPLAPQRLHFTTVHQLPLHLAQNANHNVATCQVYIHDTKPTIWLLTKLYSHQLNLTDLQDYPKHVKQNCPSFPDHDTVNTGTTQDLAWICKTSAICWCYI